MGIRNAVNFNTLGFAAASLNSFIYSYAVFILMVKKAKIDHELDEAIKILREARRQNKIIFLKGVIGYIKAMYIPAGKEGK